MLARSLDPLLGVPEATRQAFEEWYRQAKIAQIRYVAFLTMVLYLIYAGIEQNVESDQPFARLLIHALLVPGALLAIGLLSFYPRRQSWMLGLLTVAPIVSVVANLYFNFGTPRFALYAPEIYLNLMWTFAISGLALKRAMGTSLVSLAAILLVTLEDSLAPGPQRLHLIWILASFSFGLLSAIMLERAHKLMFLHQGSLERSANLDSLTGLWNRSCTQRFLADEVERANRYGTRFSVVLIDIDHFKQVNDTHGHAVGDKVLCQFAALLRDSVRVVDRVGRLGGEEFLILLPEIGARQAQLAVKALQRRINGFEFDTVQSKTASFGIAEYRAGESADNLMLRADQALYRAKAAGRDCIEVL
ncbi:GGDEF domain-containing protein [Pseudomonas sp. GOM7]|uniref:GGDEF domain-containing protein n=1 Tax=Pseudomonas sp. GOM7 TaxID=2998079 RepID=UPI00227A4789|nr:GGDEF domain-containing protein [Pseudomonas sp. GOM7]WAJ39987.1 GGDEF domain-containing protein [Pseudomonas sp. GOM7]